MKKLTAACALFLVLSGSAIAQSDSYGPGRELAEQVYGSIEDNPDGAADLGEFVKFGGDIFVSMDYDQNGSIDIDEFRSWDFGFDYIAEGEGQERAFETAQKIIFAIWDRDTDGSISQSEYQKSMASDFRRADTNDDAYLSRKEFLSGYIVVLAYRAAIVGK